MCIMQIGCRKKPKIYLIDIWTCTQFTLSTHFPNVISSECFTHICLFILQRLLVCGHFVQGTFLPTNKFLLRQSLPKGKESYLGCLSLPPIHFHPLNEKVASIAFLIFFYDQSSHYYFLAAWVVFKWNFVEILQRKKMWGQAVKPTLPHLVEGSEQGAWGCACSCRCRGGDGASHPPSSLPWARGSRHRGVGESQSPHCHAPSSPTRFQDPDQGLRHLELLSSLCKEKSHKMHVR